MIPLLNERAKVYDRYLVTRNVMETGFAFIARAVRGEKPNSQDSAQANSKHLMRLPLDALRASTRSTWSLDGVDFH